MAESNPIIQGFKGESFLHVGMLVNMYCGHCQGDGCDECDGSGTVLVRITSVEPESLGTLEPNDCVKVETTLVCDQTFPPVASAQFETCKPCGGDGRITENPQSPKCPTCGGSGKVPTT